MGKLIIIKKPPGKNSILYLLSGHPGPPLGLVSFHKQPEYNIGCGVIQLGLKVSPHHEIKSKRRGMEVDALTPCLFSPLRIYPVCCSEEGG